MTKMTKISPAMLLGGLVATCLPLAAEAAVVYALDTSSLDLQAGEQGTVEVYLDFTGDERQALLDAGGLLAGGVGVTAELPTPNEPSRPVGVMMDATFDDLFSTAEVDPATLTGFISGEFFPTEPGQDNGTRSRIRLGSFTFEAGGLGTTTFVFGDVDPDPLSDDIVIDDGVDIVAFDSLLVPATLTVSVVPEPAGLLAAAGLGVLLRRRR